MGYMFTMILGPMKSGKSLELLARMAPYEYTDKNVLYVQPEANTRDEGIQSRMGVKATAITVGSLHEVSQPFDVVGLDEVHMFAEDDARVVDKWLLDGKNVIATGLDLDYRSRMLPIIMRLLELKPDEYIAKLAVCDSCKEYNAQFTQILSNSVPILSGVPSVIPEDGTYEYQARCRDCFVKE